MNLPDVEIERLPQIIAGPILRRVEKNHVSVWLAFKDPQRVTLRVYPHTASYSGSGAGTSGRPPEVLIGSRDTIKIGKHLHVACVTATTVDSDNQLEPGIIYYYDIALSTHGTSVIGNQYENNLNSFELLNNRGNSERPVERYLALGYEEDKLPSFSLPPVDIRNLRIFHASCRKPHAPGKDALSALDEIIDLDGKSANYRPHHLIFHGDQIYADDVSTPLLPYLTAWGNALLGWVETIPGIDANGGAIPITDTVFRAGSRDKVVRDHANFTSEHSSNHLISLGEYYCMYLFVLSQEIIAASAYWLSPRAVLGDEIADLEDMYQNTWKFSPIVPSSVRDAHELVCTYRKDLLNTQSFIDELPKVRRVLANVPTYMIFDDHEVTDDWYLNEEWTRDKLRPENLLARRIMTNALIAYSIFQAWGNTPIEFETGAGAQFLYTAQQWNDSDATYIDTLSSLVGVEDFGVTPAQRLFFDYDITYSGVTQSGTSYATHRIIVLDTRTWRLFDGNEAAGLVRPDMLQRQLVRRISVDPSVDVTLVVSPVPVIGLPLMEELFQPFFKDLPFFGGLEFADYEAWSFHERSFQDILHALSDVPRVVILSGDVHYGFSSACEYWKSTSVDGSVFAQLTSSSLKNQESLTEQLHKRGYDPLGPVIRTISPKGLVFHKWENPNRNLLLKKIGSTPAWMAPDYYVGLQSWRIREDLVVAEDMSLHSVSRGPDASYRVFYAADTRPLPPGSGGVVEQSPYLERLPNGGRRSALDSYERVGAFHRKFLDEKGSGREVVGLNNLGEVTFDINPIKVYHRLWWHLPTLGVHPYTQYEIQLTPTTQRPTVLVES